ncbi:MAG TPA: alpha/beta hydrolase-fold protein [Vicinamibacteria bacterium]|nr:alpha/beta hydrolase-fold protein [Vicinamibacteria bacterium]
MSKLKTGWYSDRLGREVGVVRWGEIGTPVLLFPTAGGDAEEVERFHVIDSLSELLASGRIKVYSCDSVAGRAMLVNEGSPEHRMWLLNQFEQFVYYELVPAIRRDCATENVGVIAAGSSIGAFNALAVLCRYPDAFTHALCISGTYDLDRFFGRTPTEDLYFASPLHFLPGLEGELLGALRNRFVLLASGEGQAENIGESWRVANSLGDKGVPNRLDSWGSDWHHDWATWRRMFPQYLEELTR